MSQGLIDFELINKFVLLINIHQNAHSNYHKTINNVRQDVD